ncbi:LysM peptidoglycan-binding domain-containing protein [Fructobacillus sp. M2-14]|uniref:LysM peptidoglycan-binding domain-containing protein n=1 Tax=Fructobacillus broussonetiae TaxID=2713173 RepID=A0ABS5R4R1_9LACO|nr:peptidoglycan amidohydrolase family protein [Fructobacillus broussonetiae]MBS9339132.1 LysM peptidoglycan-binding domain-containing protein [Fructobacillus broussonetiae]
MTEKNKMKQLSKRLMVTAGATTLAATGAVLGATVVGNGMTASANSVDDQGQSKSTSKWAANSVDQVKAAIQDQGVSSINDYQTKWGDTLTTIAQAFGITTDDAANQLGLQDQGLLVAGQKMDKQAEVIQGLKDAGYLKDGEKQADFGNGDQNMIMVQQDNNQAPASNTVNEGEVNSQVSSQNDKASADERASQAAKASYEANKAQWNAAQQNKQSENNTDSQENKAAASSDNNGSNNNQASEATDNNAGNNGDDSDVEGISNKMAPDDQENNTHSSEAPQPAPQPASQAPAPTPAPAPQPSQANVTPAQQNRVDTEALINWFENNRGKLTYSMYGSRNGSDGTADCSGAMVEALYEAGASKPAWLYNTDSMHSYLQQNGYHLISSSQEWQAERGDIVIWGARGASGGAAGHVQVMVDDTNAISVNYATSGQKGTAVSTWNFDHVYDYEAAQNGGNLPFYVYRQ